VLFRSGGNVEVEYCSACTLELFAPWVPLGGALIPVLFTFEGSGYIE